MVLTPLGLRFQGRLLPCSIGQGGTTHNKQEGDRATPVGAHSIVGIMYRPDRMRPPTRWAMPIHPGDLWSDDPLDVDYNQLVRTPYGRSHERLRRSDPLYDLVILTGWNWPNSVSDRGSAIFMHQWRRPGYPTEGCVAMRRDHLWWIAQRITTTTRLVVT